MSKAEKVGDEDRKGEETLNMRVYRRGYRCPSQIGKALLGGHLLRLPCMPVASCFSSLMN